VFLPSTPAVQRVLANTHLPFLCTHDVPDELADCSGNLTHRTPYRLLAEFFSYLLPVTFHLTAFSGCQKAARAIQGVPTLQRSTEQVSRIDHLCVSDNLLNYNLPQGLHHSLWICPACGPAASERYSDSKPEGVRAGSITDHTLKELTVATVYTHHQNPTTMNGTQCIRKTLKTILSESFLTVPSFLPKSLLCTAHHPPAPCANG